VSFSLPRYHYEVLNFIKYKTGEKTGQGQAIVQKGYCNIPCCNHVAKPYTGLPWYQVPETGRTAAGTTGFKKP